MKQEPFYGKLEFGVISGEPLTNNPSVLFSHFPCKIDPYNGPYLAGIIEKPDHGIIELTNDQAFGNTPWGNLPECWTLENTICVVGDINSSLKPGDSIITAVTNDFGKAEELALRMGYRPVLAGEFLQIMSQYDGYGGWFYCYSGRKEGYAVLAHYSKYNPPGKKIDSITFDTYIGSQIKDGYIRSNSDNYCFFVKSE